jgi:hypothetical protein
MSANIRLAQKACFGQKLAHFCDEVKKKVLIPSTGGIRRQ